jgi:ABC-type dipeptide/oligopeptide/nickel transport system ATPase subunit
MRKLRGKEIGFIFQDPLTSLNPTLTIGYQIGEAIKEHMGLSSKAARERITELLAKVGIPRPKDRLNDYPFQFSGGMRQRVMIAIALSCDPKLILADEPTTALDVTIQAQILELIQRLSSEFGTAVLLITHDLGIADAICVGPARLAAADRRRARRPAADDRGHAAAPHRTAQGVPFRAALRLRTGYLLEQRAGAHSESRTGALRAVLCHRA